MTPEERLGLSPEEYKEFEELREQTQCDKNFNCVHTEIKMLCKTKSHPDVNIIECLEQAVTECKFSKPFLSTHICTCHMRKFFAQNFEEWMTTPST
jgi:hypothetical protein